MTIPPIVSAIAVGVATWLIVAVLWASVSAPGDRNVAAALASYGVAGVAAYLTYRARTKPKS